jgi:hypothetical protein
VDAATKSPRLQALIAQHIGNATGGNSTAERAADLARKAMSSENGDGFALICFCGFVSVWATTQVGR